MHAQNTSFKSRKVQAEYVGQFDPKSSQNEVISFMYPTGAPIPGGNSYKSFYSSRKSIKTIVPFQNRVYRKIDHSI